MRKKSISTKSPTLEEVQKRFEHWREHRKQRSPIPESLWEWAVRLCADHSLCAVVNLLRLDCNSLKGPSSVPSPAPISKSRETSLLLQVTPAYLHRCQAERGEDCGKALRR